MRVSGGRRPLQLPLVPIVLALLALFDLRGELQLLADATAGKAVVAKVNVDEAPGVASRFRVSSIPTLLFFKNGEVHGQVVGLQSEADLTSRLNALM